MRASTIQCQSNQDLLISCFGVLVLCWSPLSLLMHKKDTYGETFLHVLLQKYVPSCSRRTYRLMPWSRNVWCLWPSTTTGASLQSYLKLHKAILSTRHFHSLWWNMWSVEIRSNWKWIWNTNILGFPVESRHKKHGHLLYLYIYIYPSILMYFWLSKSLTESNMPLCPVGIPSIVGRMFSTDEGVLKFVHVCSTSQAGKTTMTQQEVCQD